MQVNEAEEVDGRPRVYSEDFLPGDGLLTSNYPLGVNLASGLRDRSQKRRTTVSVPHEPRKTGM